MPTLLDDAPPTETIRDTAAAERLRSTMAATKVSFTWFGVRKSLSPAQKERAADSFAAEATFLSAAKKLLDTRHAVYQAVTTVRGQALHFWRSLTLPYPEVGIRLIRQNDVAGFDRQLTVFRDDLANAVDQLDRQFAELKDQARQRLGDLYNPNDYPVSLRDEFAMQWEFPAVEPPDYLRQLNPQLYEQECQRMQSRFQEAVELAEQAFLDELSKLVSHLTERLAGMPRFPVFVRVRDESPARSLLTHPGETLMRVTHATPLTRRFELIEGRSNKFWEVRREGTEVVIRFGRIGTGGQGVRKPCQDHAAAEKQIDKLIREKTSKGYVEVPA